MRTPSPLRPVAATIACALLASACTGIPKPPVTLAEVGTVKLGPYTMPKGYLTRDEYPDTAALLAAPPAEGSTAQADDVQAYRTLTALQSGPRGAQAAKDAELMFPAAASTFACALGVPVSEQATPHLYMLLRRTLTDAADATQKAKNKYMRPRPFVVFNAPSCTPQDEASLRKSGSYPSGHSAVGWAWAEVLTEIAPERTDALLQRGRAYGQSRGICGVHWKSDIEAGRLMGAATVARLRANDVFNAQVAAARAEVAQARAAGRQPPAADCAAEASALALSAQLAP
ncbi:acid phosphatase [Pseudorhodoferax sp.]|uniref:acid phosphatase n=1 Tax=Pseudorhodoferax sp. TaxID=1993553 RepID=UPI0039E4B8FF